MIGTIGVGERLILGTCCLRADLEWAGKTGLRLRDDLVDTWESGQTLNGSAILR